MVSKCYVCRREQRFMAYEIRVKEDSKKTCYYVCSASCLADFAERLVNMEAAVEVA